MADQFDYQAHPYGTKVIGPFVDSYRLTVLDYRVPYLAANKREDGSWWLVLDERFGIECSDDDLRKWVPFLADAMAVAAGYSCHGDHSGPTNPFKTRLLGVTPSGSEAQPR